MKVFISWSGEKSRKVGDLLDEWLQCVIQAIDPWMSSKDIDRGSLWFSEITSQLKDTTIGIICLTKENINKPWILFEAGALAKGLNSSRVCTFLIDLDTTDIQDPLAQFNHTTPDQNGLYNLIRTLNADLGEGGLKDKVLEQVFNTYWPQFEEKFNKIIDETSVTEEVVIERSEDDMLKELLGLSRNMDKRIRSLETSNKKSFESHRKTKTKVSYNAAPYIKALRDLDLPAGEIIERLSDLLNVNEDVALEIYDEYLKNNDLSISNVKLKITK
jgi:hypothetical protein